MDPFRSSLIWVHTVCLYAKCKFEKFARRCSRRHKQTTFSDADFLGALKVNDVPKSKSSGIANSVDLEQWPHFVPYELDLYSLFRSVCPNIQCKYG